MVRTDEPELNGLRVYRASRLEALVGPLLAMLDAWPPDDLLAPQTILVAHPGMRHWLRRELARRRGPASIVANLDLCLPGTFFEAEIGRRCGESATTLLGYRQEPLRWVVFSALDAVEDRSLRRSLDTSDPHRRFQLADRLASIFVRLQVYRPDWLTAWAQGRETAADPPFLAPLWREIQRRRPGKPRGVLLQELLQVHSSSTEALLPPLHVFGFSHLPPIEFGFLCAEARHRLVCLYFPDPCVHFWAGLGNDRGWLARLSELGPGEEAERELQALGHPLLAAYGRIGQHFGLTLLDAAAATTADVRHSEDESNRQQDPNLLAWLQEGIRQMQPNRPPPTGSDLLRDASLRVHGCHTRLRELEVVRDAILDAMADDPSLTPGEIVVMAPNPAAYVPLLPAVFGTPGDEEGHLPWHCADLALRQAHPLFDAFLTFVQLPRTRIEAAQVLDLLSVTTIRRALGLDEDDLDALRRWLSDAGVAWGLDANSRQAIGLPGYAEYGFGWGMARLVTGYVIGDADSETLASRTGSWPVAGVAGVSVAALGGLDRFLAIIAEWCEAATSGLPALEWCARLQALLDALFQPDPEDPSATTAVATLRAIVQRLREQFQIADTNPVLAHATLCALVDEALADVPEHQSWLLGGITFCGMVPQRAIPFRMIAVLGLNDGEFPRSSGDDGLDPMVSHPRIGDRDTHSDDRYLFLQTLMSARQRLHLSFQHESAQDGKPRNPAAPLAELMAFLEAHLGRDRPWYVAHPLQPFDSRCFDGRDPRLASFSQTYAAMQPGSNEADRERFAVDAETVIPIPETRDVSLAAVTRFYRDPATELLRDRFHLHLDALTEDRSDAREPLSPKPDPIDRLPARVLFEALARRSFSLPDALPDVWRMSGRLPAGRLGEQAYRRIVEEVEPLLARAAHDPDLGTGLPPRKPIAIDLDLGRVRLHGTVSRVYAQGGRWLLFDAFPGKSITDLTFRDRLPLFLEWAALRLAYPDQPLRMVLLTHGSARASPKWDETLNTVDGKAMSAEIRTRLIRLIDFYHEAVAKPLRYFPKTSWAAAVADPELRSAKMRDAWRGSRFGTGERDHAPGYTRLLARGFDPDDPASPEGAALVEAAALLYATITFDRDGDQA